MDGSIHDRVESYLKKCHEHIINEKVETLQKINKRKQKVGAMAGDDKLLRSLNQKDFKISRRLKDARFVMRYICKLIFIPISHDESKIPYLSPFGTFCDRYAFYYEPSILSLDDKSLSEIVCCEIFNSWHNLYYNGQLSEIKAKIARCTSLLMMHHIGMIKEKLWYGENGREDLLAKSKKKYPDFNYISFEPNGEAVRFLFNKMLNDDRKSLFGELEKQYETESIIEFGLRVKYWFLVEFAGLSDHTEYMVRKLYCKILPNGKLERAIGNTRDVKDHKEVVIVAKKLIGGGVEQDD